MTAINCTILGLLAVLLSVFGPAAAHADPQTDSGLNLACTAGQKYMEIAASGDLDKMGDLFADRVDYIGPDAQARETRAEVAKMYTASKSISPTRRGYTFRIVNLAPIGKDECLMEFEDVDQATGASFLSAIDHFRVNQSGKIVFFRPFVQTAAILKSPIFRAALTSALAGRPWP